MKKIFRKTLLVLVIGYVVNTLTLLALGKTSLMTRIANDTHITYGEYQWTKYVAISSNLTLSEKQRTILKELYLNTKAEIEYLDIGSKNQLDGQLGFSERYQHVIFVEGGLFWPLYTVEESEKMDEYSQSYQRKYIWLLIGWVKVEEKFLGIS